MTSVANFERRLQKLESRITDGSGFRPASRRWLEYWSRKVSQILAGEERGKPGCIPLAVWDAIGSPDQSASGNSSDIENVVADNA